MRVTLTVTKGPEEGRVIEFAEPRGFVIGRSKDADLKLSSDDPYVSRRHIFLEICPPRCRLQNLGTSGDGATNPPHVNGDTVLEDCDLKAGDVIELGYTKLRVAIAAPVEPQPRKCSTCGEPLDQTAIASRLDECSRCAGRRKSPVARPAVRLSVRCRECRIDLSDRANSDGQADALREVAICLCESCLFNVYYNAELGKSQDFGRHSIGPYRVLRSIGEGGMGTVYLVYHEPTARVLALKRMKDLTEKVLAKRFAREIRVARELVHGNVVRCVDVGIDGQGSPFLVTEYLPGGDLESQLAASGRRLPADLAISLVCKVLDGLEYLHDRQIIHRDIKPQNILMTSVPGARWRDANTPKISDFGLAVSYARAGGTRLTSRGTYLGTLMYMPPEQVRDAFSVGGTADLYAVGVTLYYLLTGRYTFEFPTEEDVRALQKQKPDLWRKPQEALRVLMQLHRIAHPFQIILSEEPVPIQKRDASIDSRLASVIDKAVRKNARERFQTAAEFRAALERAVA
jgi:serine/threonine-protein kinase